MARKIGNSFFSALCVFLLSFFLFPASIYSQTGMLSPYSGFGVGAVQPYLNVRNMSLGGIGVGTNGKGHTNPYNPATYRAGVDTLSVRFDIGFNVGMNTLQQKDGDEIYKNQSTAGGLSNLEFYFPICKWYKMGVYLLPVTDMYYYTSSFSKPDEEIPQIGQTQLIHEGTGGLSKLGWGHSLGWGPVSVGVNFNYVFGKLMQTSTLKFLDDTLAAYAGEAEYYTETKLNGFAMDVGLSYSARILPDQYLSIGASYSLKSELHGRRTTLAQGNFTSGSDTAFLPEDAVRGVFVYPSTIRAGLSYEHVGQFLIGADMSYTWWNEYSEYGRKYDFFRNTYSVNFGAELKNDPQAASKARAVDYRIGGFFQTLYAAYDGQEFASFGVSLGVGIPVRRTRSMINIGVQYGRVGALRKGQIQEDYFRIGVSFSSVETWFVKPKYD